MTYPDPPLIPGAEALIEWFGVWPSFHDAEVLEINLKRSGQSSFRVHTWRMTKEVDATGHYITDHHVVVTFWLDDVSDLELADFSHQNVIFSLACEPAPCGFRFTFSPCYGVAGYIEAAGASVTLAPGAPPECS